MIFGKVGYSLFNNLLSFDKFGVEGWLVVFIRVKNGKEVCGLEVSIKDKLNHSETKVLSKLELRLLEEVLVQFESLLCKIFLESFVQFQSLGWFCWSRVIVLAVALPDELPQPAAAAGCRQSRSARAPQPADGP